MFNKFLALNIRFDYTIKPVLSCHSKIDKTKVLKTNGSLMKVESIAECSLGAFCDTFDLHKARINLENQFLVFFLSGCLRQVLLFLFFFYRHLLQRSCSIITNIICIYFYFMHCMYLDESVQEHALV